MDRAITLVHQLQLDALNPAIAVSTLLRRVKLTAAKLGVAEVEKWVEAEANGYDNVELPDYRIAIGHPKCRNPARGDWMPIMGAPDFIATISKVGIWEPIASLEETIATMRVDHDGYAFYSYTPKQLSQLRPLMDYPYGEMGIVFGSSTFAAIIDKVRGLVMDWALDLERAGIKGDFMSFSSEERVSASKTSIHISTFNGNLHAGDLSGSAAHVSFGGGDSSHNTASANGASLYEMVARSVSEGVSDATERKALIEGIETMRREHGQKGFAAAYMRFAQLAANHMTLIAPFLPALAAFHN